MTNSLNYSFVFGFEKEFSSYLKQKWVAENWRMTVFGVSTIYTILILSGQRLMKNRPPFEIRPLLILWNLCLSLFSIFASFRMIPETIHIIKHHGFRGSLCNNSYVFDTPVCVFWTWLFVLSKIVELGDTMFIILRKQKLIFLHWYHHVTAMLGVWHSYATGYSMGRWTLVMNVFIHSIMYTYYCFRAMRIKVPRLIAKSITMMQILQMFIGLGLAILTLCIYFRGDVCNVTFYNTGICFLVYFTDLILFVHFFRKTYYKKTLDSKSN